MIDKIFIGISGPKGAGKNLYAEYLQKHLHELHDIKVTAAITAFADPLKRLIFSVFGVDCYQEDKNSLTEAYWGMFPKIAINKDKNPHTLMTVRELMQTVGTEVCRRGCPSIWANAPFRRIWDPTVRFVIIPDLRFLNEFKNIRSCDGVTVRINRKSVDNQDIHVSENELSGMDDIFDYVFNNDGTISDVSIHARYLAEEVSEKLKKKIS
jgi:hypothetical protein